MKKSDLRQLIKEEIEKGNYPELHKVYTDKSNPPFMTEQEFEDKWTKKLSEEEVNEALVSFDFAEIVKRAKPLFVLLGDNQLQKSKLVKDIHTSLTKYSSLKAR